MATVLWRIAAAFLLVGTIVSARVYADPLLVQAGGFSYAGDPFGWRLIGDAFSVGGGGSIPLQSVLNSCGFLPCTPRTTIDLSSVLGGDFRPGSLGYGGATIRG